MSRTVNYYHFLISPFSYIAIKQFNELTARHDLKVNYLPMAPRQVFGETGGVPPAKRHPSRQRLRMDELTRWKAYIGLDKMNLTPAYFPADQSLGAQMVLAAGGGSANPDAGKLSDALLRTVWEEEKDIADEGVLVAAADAVGLAGADLLSQAKEEQWVSAYAKTTETAIASGVIGSPTYEVGDELFWGQDRIEFLDRALA